MSLGLWYQLEDPTRLTRQATGGTLRPQRKSSLDSSDHAAHVTINTSMSDMAVYSCFNIFLVNGSNAAILWFSWYNNFTNIFLKRPLCQRLLYYCLY